MVARLEQILKTAITQTILLLLIHILPPKLNRVELQTGAIFQTATILAMQLMELEQVLLIVVII